MKNVVWVALIIGFVVGGISGYSIRVLTVSDSASAQEELAKAMLKDRQDAKENWEKTKESLHGASRK